ncbi:MAG: MFS transporter [Deltaproteobacteria bacterium]|jgi:DHA1 family multidrug resistance protein-like MFS transporter|nr:MFS transporter [Deltaproteobacteria bacterium]MBW2478493.1 MFS transporter [Deltaproteobacteria bacterium]
MLIWRRNLYVLFSAQMLSMVGFSMVLPFLPLYIKELGVGTWGTIEFWSGMVFSAQAITMMISAPLWGAVADRYGRKLMLIRATLGGAVLIALMGFVNSAEQLTLLRALQGLVTGTIPAATALVASATPREHSGESIGLLQTGTWIGVAIGPLIGGVIGDTFGFRECFWITGSLLALSGFATILWVREDFRPAVTDKRQSVLESFRGLLSAPNMLSLYGVTFLQTTGRMLFFPIAALFVMELMQSASGAAVATGLMMGINAVTGSISAVWLGRIGDRIGHLRILLFSLVASIGLYLPQALVDATWQLILLQALTGFAYGGILPTIGALMNLQLPAGTQGATYGLNASITAAGRSVAPLLAAVFAMWLGVRSVFILAAAIYGLAAIVVLHVAVTKDSPSPPGQ